MTMLLQRPEPRCLMKDGRLYVGVTSAMALCKHLLQEEPDFFGPLAKMHAAEGTGAHACTLDWLAHKHDWLPEYTVPVRPEIHPDESRWANVMHAAQQGFQAFVEQYDVVPVAIEAECFSAALGLVGHVDLLANLTWKKRRVLAVIDLKFVAAIQESHKLQLRCYSRMDHIKGVNLGLLYHANRQTGVWRLEQVDLHAGLEDVAAVANAARLWAWAEQRNSRL